ncbi:hypothetical protein [Nocardia salmonicida]|uniref:hypothetical protein n=1 Tax=Nocardia salmonicida TaxID=53431 RepID=UPI003CF515CE
MLNFIALRCSAGTCERSSRNAFHHKIIESGDLLDSSQFLTSSTSSAFAAVQTGHRDIAVVLAFVIGLGAPVILLAITAAFTNVSLSPARYLRHSLDRKHLIT